MRAGKKFPLENHAFRACFGEVSREGRSRWATSDNGHIKVRLQLIYRSLASITLAYLANP